MAQNTKAPLRRTAPYPRVDPWSGKFDTAATAIWGAPSSQAKPATQATLRTDARAVSAASQIFPHLPSNAGAATQPIRRLPQEKK
jgi:hypothetical protein